MIECLLFAALMTRPEAETPPQAESFERFEDVSVRWDDTYLYIESDGLPSHPMMVGIRSWNQQVPIPHPYTGRNAFRIPLEPRPLETPVALPFQGAVAVAVNGVPIFNPIKQDGRTDTFAHGELDEHGGHAGRGDDYHYHILPEHLVETVGRGRPIAWSLDGHPIMPGTEATGARPRGLDQSRGHDHDHELGYHYHASDDFPYINASFHSAFDAALQPRAEGIRPHTQPLRGATITGWKTIGEAAWRVEYSVLGQECWVEYRESTPGTFTYTFHDGSRTTTQVHRRRAGNRNGPPPPRQDKPPRNDDRPPPPPRDDRRTPDRPHRNPRTEPPRDAPPRADAAKQPNIIFLLSDDQSWNGLSVTMDPDEPRSRNSFVDTPNLERLAADGMCLSDAYAPAPVCAPSRISILTGKSPARLQWTKAGPSLRAANGLPLVPPVNGRNIPTSEVTIPELLKASGYRTAHLGKWHIGGGGPGAHGFDVHDGNTGNGDAEPFVDPNPVDIVGMTDRATAFIDESIEREQPFYLQMSYYALHYPENASKASVAKYRAKGPRKRSREIQRAAIAEDLDTGVGVLLERLAERGLDENTIVIYMGDNGASDRDNPLRGGKGGLGEGGVRVPFIIRGPGIEPGSHSDLRVTGMDLLPTFARLAGSAEAFPDMLEGGDVMPALVGKTDVVERPLPYVVFHFPHYQGTSRPQSSILMGDLKLVRYYEDGRTELFDLATDPGETRDLVTTRPEEAKRLEAALVTYLARVDAGLPRTNPQFDPEATIPPLKPGGREGGGRERRDRDGDGRDERGRGGDRSGT